jgi:hypothetical protein
MKTPVEIVVGMVWLLSAFIYTTGWVYLLIINRFGKEN